MDYLIKQPSAPSRVSRSTQLLHRDQYWPEIDGLRTVAVISVFAFHLDARLYGGGFVGVDIFFVISGYLITTLLLNDIENKSFSIFRFYQRRLARIAPAALLVVTITMIGGRVIYSYLDFASLGANSVAASLSFINIKEVFQGNYFVSSPDAKPLIHYWSLAIEEQFYVIFPVLLYGVMKTPYPLLCLLICCAMSFFGCVIITPFAPVAAFYLLPTRAWELLAGSCLAIAKKIYPQPGKRISSLCLAVGSIFILLSFALIRSDVFPGWIASLPVVGSTLMLAGIGNARDVIQRMLALPVMVFVGKRSYSLYLWHWPIFSFVDYRYFQSSQAVVLALKIIVTIGATLLTYRFIERPMRRWLNAPQRRGLTFGTFIVAAMALSTAGYIIRSNNYYLGAEPSKVTGGGISVNPGGHNGVVMIGDSMGAMYSHEVASIAHTLGFRLNILNVGGRNELPGQQNTLWPSVSQFLSTARPDVVILSCQWSSKLSEDLRRDFGDAVAFLLDKAANIIVIIQPPMPPQDSTRHAILAGVRPPFFEDHTGKENRIRAGRIIREFESSRLQVLDAADIFLNSDNSIRVIGSDGRRLFEDTDHLSDSGTALVRPKLEQTLRERLHIPEHP